MKNINTPILLILLLSIIPSLPSIPLDGTCRDACGTVAVKFPFGSGPGCGHPDFSPYVQCSPDGTTLHFSAARGGAATYPIASIDYAARTLVVADPLMSTCAAMQDSGGFSLGRSGGGPITAAPDNTFALLGCSATSPVFDPDSGLCEAGSGLRVCRGLYSCEGVRGIGLEPHAPATTCCVYDPVDPVGSSGPGLDLARLQCSSYAAVYGFGGSEGDPMRWQYGILMEYSYNDSHSGGGGGGGCKNCEESGGFCGYGGVREEFVCRCRNGVNTTVNCYGRGYGWSGTAGVKIQTALTIGGKKNSKG